MTLATLFSLATFFFFPTQDLDCPFANEIFRSAQMTTLEFQKTRQCAKYLQKVGTKSAFRSHLFTSDGLYLIFNNFGPGPEATETGARTYWFFPRQRQPNFVIHPEGEVEVQLPTSANLIFDADRVHLVAASEMEIQEAEDIVKGNNGGVEVLHYSGLWLDNGFHLGEVAYTRPRAQSTFHDHRGQSCTVTNSDLFTYEYDQAPNGDTVLVGVYFKFHWAENGDARLKGFLSEHCPNLEITF